MAQDDPLTRCGEKNIVFAHDVATTYGRKPDVTSTAGTGYPVTSSICYVAESDTPPFRGGLFFWADQEGLPGLIEKLERLGSLGARFNVPKLLKEKADSDGKFYER